MAKKYGTMVVANYGVSEKVLELIINNEQLIEKSSMSLQDRINNESNSQITIVVSDIDNSKNDSLIIALNEQIEKDLHSEIIELVSVFKEVSSDRIDNLNIYAM